MAGRERYEALRAVAHHFRRDFPLALDLAYSTGHRIGAILRLRWEDADLAPSIDAPWGRIRWRGEFDKIGNEHVTPMNELAHKALSRAREESPGIGGAWVFPSDSDPTRPVDRRLMSHTLRKAERKAGLEHVWGGGWHAFGGGRRSGRRTP